MTMPFLQNIPPFIFFTGKGGVGKNLSGLRDGGMAG